MKGALQEFTQALEVKAPYYLSLFGSSCRLCGFFVVVYADKGLRHHQVAVCESGFHHEIAAEKGGRQHALFGRGNDGLLPSVCAAWNDKPEFERPLFSTLAENKHALRHFEVVHESLGREAHLTADSWALQDIGRNTSWKIQM
jgi:hypothetical protein